MLLHDLLERTYEYVAGSLVLQLSGIFSLAEAASREAVEAAVNLLYILQDKPREMLVTYLADYIQSQEQKMSAGKVLQPI